MLYHGATGIYKKFSILSIALIFALTSVGGTLASLLLTQKVEAAGIAVRPSNLNGWSTSGTGGSFSNEQAKIGSGSYKFTTGTNGGQKHLINKGFAGTKLSDITTLGYSSYVAARDSASAAPLVRIDTTLPGKNFLNMPTQVNTTLIWEPANGPQSTVGTWQDYNPLTQGRWWASPKVDAFPDANTYKTWSEIIALYPNATVRAGNGVYLSAGQNSAGAPWSNFVGYVDNFKFNGNVYNFEPNANPVINGENFNTHSGADYKGVNVGFNIADFGTVSNVTVDLYKDATKLATNTSNSALLALINGGENQLSTPFIIEPGAYTEAYWDLGAHTLGFNTKPTKAVVTVTGENGTRTIDITPLTEPNDWVYESLVPLATPTLQSPTDNAIVNGATLTNSWATVDGATKYEYRSFNNAAGTNLRHQQILNGTSKTATNVANNTSFWWQVRAINDHRQSEWSPLWKVTIDNEVPTTPTNGQPHNVFKKTVGDWSYTWNASTDNQGPIKYEYQTSTNPAQIGGILSTDLTTNTTTSTTAPSAGTPDGKRYWQVRAVDSAGNKSGWSPIWNVAIDTVKPVINDITPGANSTVKGTVTFKLDWSDNNKSYSYIEFNKNGAWKLDNTQDTNPNADELTINTKDYADGVYGIKATATDKAGNSVQQTFTFTIDNSKPTLTFVTPDDNALKSGVFPVTVNAADNLNLNRIAVNIYDEANSQLIKACGSTSGNTPLNVLSNQFTCTAGDGLADGTYTLRASASDLSNNTTVATRTVRVDNDAPIITKPVRFTDGNVAENAYINGTKTFRVEQTEANPDRIYVEYQIMNTSTGKWEKKQGQEFKNTNVAEFTVNTSDYPEGVNQVKISTRDKLNRNSGHSFLVNVDRTLPVATINAPSNGATFGGTTYPTINFTVEDTNIESWTLTGSGINESGTTSGTFDRIWNTSGLPSGTHTVSLNVRDKAGNVSATSLQINVDNYASLAISGISNDDILSGFETITANLGENGTIDTFVFKDEDGNEVTVNGTTTLATGELRFRFNTTQLANGEYTVTITGRDALGNSAPASTIAFEVFNAPFVPNNNTSTSGTPILLATTTPIPAGLAVNQFNTNNPQVLGIAVDQESASSQSGTNTNGKVKASSTKNNEKELVESTSSSFAWYWIPILIGILVAMYYGYRNWKLNKENA